MLLDCFFTFYTQGTGCFANRNYKATSKNLSVRLLEARLRGFSFTESLVTLFYVALRTEHLTVVSDRLTTFRPWLYMVSVHFFKLEVFTTKRTNSFLLLIRAAFFPVRDICKLLFPAIIFPLFLHAV